MSEVVPSTNYLKMYLGRYFPMKKVKLEIYIWLPLVAPFNENPLIDIKMYIDKLNSK